jgi:hypothetical protein
MPQDTSSLFSLEQWTKEPTRRFSHSIHIYWVLTTISNSQSIDNKMLLASSLQNKNERVELIDRLAVDGSRILHTRWDVDVCLVEGNLNQL